MHLYPLNVKNALLWPWVEFRGSCQVRRAPAIDLRGTAWDLSLALPDGPWLRFPHSVNNWWLQLLYAWISCVTVFPPFWISYVRLETFWQWGLELLLEKGDCVSNDDSQDGADGSPPHARGVVRSTVLHPYCSRMARGQWPGQRRVRSHGPAPPLAHLPWAGCTGGYHCVVRDTGDRCLGWECGYVCFTPNPRKLGLFLFVSFDCCSPKSSYMEAWFIFSKKYGPLSEVKQSVKCLHGS